MLHFVICDDNLNILDKLEKMLENIFTKNNFEAKVSFKSDNSDDILDYIKSNPADVRVLTKLCDRHLVKRLLFEHLDQCGFQRLFRFPDPLVFHFLTLSPVCIISLHIPIIVS